MDHGVIIAWTFPCDFFRLCFEQSIYYYHVSFSAKVPFKLHFVNSEKAKLWHMSLIPSTNQRKWTKWTQFTTRKSAYKIRRSKAVMLMEIYKYFLCLVFFSVIHLVCNPRVCMCKYCNLKRSTNTIATAAASATKKCEKNTYNCTIPYQFCSSRRDKRERKICEQRHIYLKYIARSRPSAVRVLIRGTK